MWAILALTGRPAGAGGPDPLDELDLTDDTVIDTVVKESQRVLPSVAGSLPRRVQHDVEIAGSPPVPAGALLVASTVVEHRNPDVYAEPGAYRPQRWLDGSAQPGPYQFFPFGVGARRCLGAAFADLQLRVTLAVLARAGRWPRLLTTRVDHRNKSGVNMAPAGRIMVEAGDGRARRAPLTGAVTRLWRS
ncbi:cytochrome P450 [Dactylosporangium sp. CA-092794]|uniref:cytochrome P450 n=1 Tax=Dactylosporangium sp. CA-092794 TaxID=3239929 RepID=UPI003D8FEB47